MHTVNGITEIVKKVQSIGESSFASTPLKNAFAYYKKGHVSNNWASISVLKAQNWGSYIANQRKIVLYLEISEMRVQGEMCAM